MMRLEVSQALEGQCGVQPWSKATSAGEFAKWELPRPQAPLRPILEPSGGQRSGDHDFSAAMRSYRPSRPGSAQGNQTHHEEVRQARRGKGLHSKVQRLEDAIAALSKELGKLGEHLMRATCQTGEPTGSGRSAALSRQENSMIDFSAALSRQVNSMIDPAVYSSPPVFSTQRHFRGGSQNPQSIWIGEIERERERERR